LSPAQFES
jgi:hypothetical protein